jgi:hypothetical protein
MPTPKELFQKARRASQQWAAKRRDSLFATVSEEGGSTSRLSFLGLPAEIRNRVYEHLAESTTLIISPQTPSKPPRPPGLLLACRQTHRELKSIWLSTAQVAAQICGYDFRALMRVLDNLSDEQTTDLCQNPNLRINIFLAHVPTKEHWRSLIDWLEYRDQHRGRDPLIFRYEVQFTSKIRGPRPTARYVNAARFVNAHHMREELLKTHIERLKRLQLAWRTIHASTWEVDHMLPDLQGCAESLERVRRPLADHWQSLTLEERQSTFTVGPAMPYQ